MPTAFVTGATGFIGGHLVRKLRESGWDIVCLCRTLPTRDRLEAHYVSGDITDFQSVLQGIPGHCDTVFHVAADISHRAGVEAAQNEVNVGGTRNVARAALAAGVRRLVHCSSDAVWGLRTPLLREDIPRRGVDEPINYQRSKFWAEEEIRCASDQGLDAVIVNPTNVLGSGDIKGWSRILLQIDRGLLGAAPPGSGAFAYVDDVAEAMIAAAHRGRTGHHYLLGGTNATYLEFMSVCARQLGKPFAEEPRSAADILREAHDEEARAATTGQSPRLSMDHARVLCAAVAADSGKAIRELDFRVRPLPEMIERTLQWFRKVRLIV